MPIPAVDEEDLVLVFRDDLNPGADLDQNGCGLEPDRRHGDLDLHVDLRAADAGTGEGHEQRGRRRARDGKPDSH
jgi:hypothetical protein